MGIELNTSTSDGTLASSGKSRRKFPGKTPTTTADSLPKRTNLPMIAGSDPNRRTQTPWEMMMVFADGARLLLDRRSGPGPAGYKAEGENSK
jgi:hypothetical protein